MWLGLLYYMQTSGLVVTNIVKYHNWISSICQWLQRSTKSMQAYSNKYECHVQYGTLKS
jgi:hypothetical protein